MTFALICAAASVGSAGTLRPIQLKCEHLVDPLGIDARVPMLSWKLEPASPGLRNLRQTSCRILVASRPDWLTEEKADVWDQEIPTSQTIEIPYGGTPLQSGTPYWWKVRVVDQNGNHSDWSETARWSMGLLNPEEWKAQWIGYDAPLRPDPSGPNFQGASWIWHPDDEVGNVAAGIRFFSTRIDLPADVTSAVLAVSADDQFELKINGASIAKSDGKTDAWRRPVEMDATTALKPGENTIEIRAENVNAGAAGVIFKLTALVKDGTRYSYASGPFWAASLREGAGLKSAKVIGPHGAAPWGRIGAAKLVLPPPRYLRKAFDVTKPVKRATAYVSALGLVELRLNGAKVGNEYFTPGWTDYEKRIYYRAYDVTKNLRSGKNAVGAIVGDGWYAGYVGYGNRREHYGSKIRAIVQLDIEFADGSRETVASGHDWKAAVGPIKESDFLMGETYDARQEVGGWDRGDYDETGWQPVDVSKEAAGRLEAFTGTPVRAFAELRAKTITRPTPDDTYVLDLGQNIAGFARLRIKGEKGRTITLRFAERLNPDGTIYTTNLRSARATDTYTSNGSKLEIWEPRFTFHGFQYIEVTGLGHQPKPDEVVAVAVSSDNDRVGTLETSDPMLNQLVSNAWWTQRMNFIDIPTDCPQRDERLGWTGDAQAYIHTATMYDDAHAFFKKWLVSLDDAQREDGQYPMVAPLKVAGGDGGPGWADAGVICPWTTYEAYGDKLLLARHYPQMKKFIEFCVNRSTPDLLPPERFHCFGDWVSIGANTPTDVIYEAYFALSASLAAKSARALGLFEDARKHEALFARIKEAFNKAYVSPEGVVKGDTQCAYVLTLAFDLLDGEMAKKAAERLVADIEKRGWKLTTGFLGTRDIMHVLSKIGRNDVAFRLLHNTEFPSWGFTIKNGATSIWERWDGWTPEKGFQDPGMNSFAHYAFGAVVGWMFDQIAGIRHASPGYEKILIAPSIDPNLTWMKSSYNSVRGRIDSEWRVEGGKLKMRVVIPPNVDAIVHIPTQSGSKRVESVLSGEYFFEEPWSR